jgi:hypothetical protein
MVERLARRQEFGARSRNHGLAFRDARRRLLGSHTFQEQQRREQGADALRQIGVLLGVVLQVRQLTGANSCRKIFH